MKKTLIAMMMTFLATQAWAKETEAMKDKKKYPSYIGSVSNRATDMHAFENLDEAYAAMKEYTQKGQQARLSSYIWTEKNLPSKEQYIVVVKKGT